MKKNGCFFSLIVLCLFININYVNADTICTKSGYNDDWTKCNGYTVTNSSLTNYNYDIWKTSFEKNKIVVQGYAFNNSYSTKGNKYKLVARQGNKSVVSYGWSSGKGGDGSKSLSKLHYVKDGCESRKYSDVSGTYALLLNIHYKAVPFCGLKKTTVTNYVFKDVEFKIELKIEKILENFNTKDNIYLYLITEQNGNYYFKKIYTAEKDIKKSGDSSEIYTDITGGNSDSATINTYGAWIRNKYNNFRKKGNSNSASSTKMTGVFIEGESYEIMGVAENKPRLYKLKLCGDKYYTKGADRFYYGTVNRKCENTFIGYAYSAWLNFKGYTRFKIKKKKEPSSSEECTPGLCIGGNCLNSMNNSCNYSEINSVSESNDTNVTIESCSTTTGDSININKPLNFSNILYYKIPGGSISFPKRLGKNEEISYTLCGGNLTSEIVKDENGDYYVPITFTSLYQYTENYGFIINNGFKNGSIVNNGLGFGFGFVYNLSYERNLVNDEIEGDSSNSFTGKNNSYIGKVNINIVKNGTCQQREAKVRLSRDDDLYYKDDSEFSTIKYSDVYKYLSDTLGDNNDENIESDVEELGVTVEFPNSNSKDGNSHYLHKDGLKYKEDSNYSYEYNLPIAYMNSEGKKQYNDSSGGYTTYLGNKYYIPYNWDSKNDFNFNIKSDTDLTLVDGIAINLNVTCTVKTEDKFSKIRYRTISVNAPFPKSKIPSNWRDWYCGNDRTCSSSNSNKIRISNSYNKEFYNKLFTKDDFDKINNNYNTSYLSWQYMDKKLPDSSFPSNGVSSFVSYWYNNLISNSFCQIGQFENSCDNYGS